MNAHRVAAALNTLSMGLAELAEAVLEQPQPAAVTPAAGSPPARPPADTTVTMPAKTYPQDDEGHEAICPAHHKPFKDGNYGPFCSELGAEPAWTNKRGYCTLTPKNAAVYLRAHAA